jgi:hypothetical protein
VQDRLHHGVHHTRGTEVQDSPGTVHLIPALNMFDRGGLPGPLFLEFVTALGLSERKISISPVVL